MGNSLATGRIFVEMLQVFVSEILRCVPDFYKKFLGNRVQLYLKLIKRHQNGYFAYKKKVWLAA